MESDLIRTEFEAVYSALSKGRLIFGSIPSKDAAVSAQKGYLDHTRQKRVNTYEITDKGRDLLRSVYIHAIQVNIPGQPPLILRNVEALVNTMNSGELSATFDLLQNGDYGEGELLFSLHEKYMSLYDLATLPEWEPN